MGIALAQVVIGLWLPVTFYLFNRYPPQRAALYAFFSGLLILPNWVSIKIPFFPPIDKTVVVTLSMCIVLWIKRPPGVGDSLEGWFKFGAVALLLSGFITGFNNPDPIVFPGNGTFIPGHNFKDAGSVALSTFLLPVPASYLGLRLFRKAEDVKLIVRVVTAAGLLYCIPILIELRLSPQMHRWVYGYTGPHEWTQLMRYGGYRPLVMLSHGLVLSLFMLLPNITAAALARVGGRIWKFSGNTATWLLTAVLVLCKSTGVWFYMLFSIPMARWASSRALVRLAIVLCTLSYVYPWLRIEGWVPLQGIYDASASFNVERADSLKFRFDNEEKLLERAELRPWFGWGSYGRNRVYDEFGVDQCVTDGGWILDLGSLGIVGFSLVYLFSAGAMIIAGRRILRVRDTELRTMMAGLLLGCAILWFDNLINAPGFTISQFLGAALCSISRNVLEEQDRARPGQRSGRGGPPARPQVAQAS